MNNLETLMQNRDIIENRIKCNKAKIEEARWASKNGIISNYNWLRSIKHEIYLDTINLHKISREIKNIQMYQSGFYYNFWKIASENLPKELLNDIEQKTMSAIDKK